MAGKTFTVRWRPSTGLGWFSAQNTGAVLGTGWTDGVDTRWDGLIVVGPEFNTVSMTNAGSSANIACQAVVFDASSNPYIYIGRGTGVLKLEPSTMAVITAGTAQAGPGNRITCLLATKAPNGNWQLSVFDGVNAYQVRTTIAVASEQDTTSSNDESAKISVAYVADDDNSVYAVENLSTTKGQTVRRNVLSTAINMDASNWVDVSSLSAGATPISISVTNDLVVIGTDKGPQILNLVSRSFNLDIARVTKLATNCLGMIFVDWLGVVMGVGTQIRVQNGENSSRIGPGTWVGNDGDIQGQAQAFSFDPDYLYAAIRNPVASKTFFLMAKPIGDSVGNGLNWYCIGNQTEDCEMIAYWGTVEGDRTQPVFGAGKGTDNIWYALGARTTRWIDDTAYRYQTNTDHTWYGTEIQLDRPARIKSWTVVGSALSATQTVKMAARVSGKGGTAATQTIGTKNTNGWERIEVPMGNAPVGTRIRPQMTLRTAVNTASPQVIGDIILELEEE